MRRANSFFAFCVVPDMYVGAAVSSPGSEKCRALFCLPFFTFVPCCCCYLLLHVTPFGFSLSDMKGGAAALHISLF